MCETQCVRFATLQLCTLRHAINVWEIRYEMCIALCALPNVHLTCSLCLIDFLNWCLIDLKNRGLRDLLGSECAKYNLHSTMCIA